MDLKTNGQSLSLFVPYTQKTHLIHFLGVDVSICSNLIGQSDIEGRHPLADTAAIQQMVRSRL